MNVGEIYRGTYLNLFYYYNKVLFLDFCLNLHAKIILGLELDC
jgi:hypothetical protein